MDFGRESAVVLTVATSLYFTALDAAELRLRSDCPADCASTLLAACLEHKVKVSEYLFWYSENLQHWRGKQRKMSVVVYGS